MAICATAVKTQQPGEHHRKDFLGESLCASFSPPAFEPLGEHRHEGRVEGAFRKQRAKQIGKAEGDDEGLRHRTGADDRCGEHVADEAQGAAHQREPAHRCRRFEERHALFSLLRLLAGVGT